MQDQDTRERYAICRINIKYWSLLRKALDRSDREWQMRCRVVS